MHRFFVSPELLTSEAIELPYSNARQLYFVLRMRGGEKVILLDNSGWEYIAELTHVTPKFARAKILDRQPNQSEPPIKITLYQCLLKKENFEWVLQKGTEIGVSEFVPVISARTIPDASLNKTQRWERILTEAAEQSRRGKIPQLRPAMPFADALKEMETYDLKIIPWEEEQNTTLKDALVGQQNVQQIALCIGAEGGFSPLEIEKAQQHHIQPVSLGERILRAETAAIYSVSVLAYHIWG